MVKLYLHDKLPGTPYFFLFESLDPDPPAWNSLFQKGKTDGRNYFEVVEQPEQADYIAMPYNYALVRRQTEYLASLGVVAEKLKKKILIFAQGDSTDKIDIPGAIVFRTSQYRSTLNSNEIIMPPRIEDMGVSGWREKKDKPTVGFMGWAAVPSLKSYGRYLSKVILAGIHTAKRPGLYFRRKAITVLRRSALIKANIVTRSTFSGHIETIGLPPEQARAEYIRNMNESDFVLSSRGDGNYSLRFFETLSAGRIPLLIDTDIILPLEDIINYSTFVVTVPMKQLNRIDRIVAETYAKIDSSQFEAMQKKARETYEKYLAFNAFFAHIFADEAAYLKSKIRS